MTTIKFDPSGICLMVAFHSTGSVLPAFAASLARLTADLVNWRIVHAVLAVEDSLVTSGRDRIAAAFLASPSTHLLMLDGDIRFTSADVLRLILAGKPLVAGPYRLKDDSGKFVVNFDADARHGGPIEWDAQTRTVAADWAGTGFLLIARQVFDAIAAADLAPVYRQPDPDGREVELRAYFEQQVVDRRRYSEDVLFCDRWRQTGGQVWLCPDVRLTHIGRKDFTGALIDAMRIDGAEATAA